MTGQFLHCLSDVLNILLVRYQRRDPPADGAADEVLGSPGMTMNICMANHAHLYAHEAVGYNFVNIDDCWAEKNRTAAGDLIEGLLN